MAGKAFFNRWELWQKMIFVLAALIALVFAIAYTKLLWVNHLLKKQEAIDEEKRTRIAELRQSGRIVESSKVDIPFGVRAIQSGIQVDGIWISNPSTPVPSELHFGNYNGSISDSAFGEGASKSVNVNSERPSSSYMPVSTVDTDTPISPFKKKATGSAFLEHTDDYKQLIPIGRPRSHQPKHSSELPHGTYRPDNGLSLSQREGSHHQRAYPKARLSSRLWQLNLGEELSLVPSNERNSCSSYDADDIYDIKGKGKADQSTKLQRFTRNDGYFEAQSEILGSTPDPFATPAGSSHFSPKATPQSTRLNSLQDISQDVLRNSLPQTRFIPGEVHQNKVVRRINSGFEVLPAGTFSNSAGLKGKAEERDERRSEDSVEKHRSKLQKKRRTSSVIDQS